MIRWPFFGPDSASRHWTAELHCAGAKLVAPIQAQAMDTITGRHYNDFFQQPRAVAGPVLAFLATLAGHISCTNACSKRLAFNPYGHLSCPMGLGVRLQF